MRRTLSLFLSLLIFSISIYLSIFSLSLSFSFSHFFFFTPPASHTKHTHNRSIKRHIDFKMKREEIKTNTQREREREFYRRNRWSEQMNLRTEIVRKSSLQKLYLLEAKIENVLTKFEKKRSKFKQHNVICTSYVKVLSQFLLNYLNQFS